MKRGIASTVKDSVVKKVFKRKCEKEKINMNRILFVGPSCSGETYLVKKKN